MIKHFFIFFTFVFLCAISISNFTKAQTISSDVNQRLNSYVNKHGVVLDESASSNIAQKCNATQAQVAILQTNTANAVRKRINIYSSLQNEIRAIELRMMRQGVDASELDLFIGKIQQGQDELTLAADKFGATTDDIRLIDCQKKPEQFKAGLIELKRLNKEVISSAYNLRSLIEKSSDTTFKPLKGRLSL